MVVCLFALGGVWTILGPTPPAKPTADDRAARPLAYQQAIAERDAKAGGDTKDDSPKKTDIPPFETVTSPQAEAAPPDGAAESSAVAALPSEEGIDAPQDMASLPDESADTQDGLPWSAQGADPSQADPSQDFAAVPGGAPAPYDGVPPMPDEAGPGPGQPGTDGAEQWRDEREAPWAYGPRPQGGRYGRPSPDPYGPPRGQADPYGPPPGGASQADQWGGQDGTEWADQNTEEWVEVVISGAAMRATASEDSPMLFAFPYGRNLKVVSRFEGWIEVTDPQSAATGWMQSHVVAPSGVNRGRYGQGQAYYDDPPQRRGGWFKRNGGGFGDMINRALGGN